MSVGRAALLSATASALALAIRSALGPPVPLWLSLGALLAYLLLLAAGALSPRLEMFAQVLWRGPDEADSVGLTFDDGPHPVHTRAVLRLLQQHGARATFFVLGHKVERCPEVLAEIVAQGHLVGVHGYRHDRLLGLRRTRAVQADLMRAVAVIEAVTGYRPTLFRPPVGQTNPVIANVARKLGLRIVGWSVRAGDGVDIAPSRVVDRVVKGLEPGAVVLMHDAAEHDDRAPAAPLALDAILKAMADRGLSAVRIDRWGTDHCQDGPR